MPLKFYQKERKISSIMIEINKTLYIDEKIQKIANYFKLKADIGEALQLLNKIFL